MHPAALNHAESQKFVKAECAERKVVRIDPQYTSQACTPCGHNCKENRMSQTKFKCVQYGFEQNADVNATLNILARAEPSGVNVAGYRKHSPRIQRP